MTSHFNDCDEAIRILSHAYKSILHSPIGHWDATVWARTLGVLWAAKERVYKEAGND